MKRLLRLYHGSEKGFTLIELLIVVAILGILAAVIVPNLIGFIGTGKVAAANTEVANVESAALAWYADNDGVFPDDSSGLATANYLNEEPKEVYNIDDYGQATPADGTSWDGDTNVVWDTVSDDKWVKAAAGG